MSRRGGESESRLGFVCLVDVGEISQLVGEKMCGFFLSVGRRFVDGDGGGWCGAERCGGHDSIYIYLHVRQIEY